MNLFYISTLIFSVAAILAFLFIGTFFFIFLERFLDARIQHRDGPGRHGSMDYSQVWKDFRKVKIKQDTTPPLSLRFRIALSAWKSLPAIFLLILLSGVLPDSMKNTGLPALLLLPLLAASLEAAFLHATTDARERLEWRKRMAIRVLGASLMAFAFLAATLKVGPPSLQGISEAQRYFPYHSIIASPGLFLCAIAALGAIFLFVNENPIQNEGELSLGRSTHYLIFFVRKMWVFCLLSFWVFVFLGGTTGLIAKIIFPIKTALVLFLFTFLQGSFPRLRSSDASELALRWLFRLCILGFLVEAVWVGVRL